MVSFIYECLDEMFHGSAIARFLYLSKGSEQVRREIRTAARLITFPFEEVVRNNTFIPFQCFVTRIYSPLSL